MKFPSKEIEIAFLATKMVDGYTAYASDFPGVAVAGLESALADYITKSNACLQTRSAMEQMTNAKNEALDTLKIVMKNDLKISEADTTASPDKLSEIGWSAKPTPGNKQAPGSPKDLASGPQGEGSITLNWKRPTDGGSIRNYSLFRTSDNPEGGLAKWTLVDFFYTNSISIENQPVSQKIYYKVNASNAYGTSGDSNILMVVL